MLLFSQHLFTGECVIAGVACMKEAEVGSSAKRLTTLAV